MKKIKKTLLFLAIILSSIGTHAQGITFDKWSSNWQQVLERAKKENKNIFVDCFATWCSPCKAMDEKVYPDSSLGKAFNSEFISVKIQFDRTANDNTKTKLWYNDAKLMEKKFNIGAYPSMLFFSSEGNLLHKAVGYRNSKELIGEAKIAISPEQRSLNKEIESYKNGLRDYAKMKNLISFSEDILNDRKLSKRISRDYIDNYIYKQNDSVILSEENIIFFISQFPILKLEDKLFKLLDSEKPVVQKVNLEQRMKLLNMIAGKYLVLNKIIVDDKPPVLEPDWKKLSKDINQKFKNVDGAKVVEQNKEWFYWKTNQFNKWALLKDKELKAKKMVSKMEIYDSLNMPAWNVFENVTQPEILQIALAWSIESNKLFNQLADFKDPGDYFAIASQLDTQANLLYKLNRKDDAIKIQQQAVMSFLKYKLIRKEPLNNLKDELLATLDKMYRGEKTWPTK